MSDTRPPYQPRAALFRVLGLLWIFPSLGALWIIASDGARWYRASSFLEGLRAVAFEQWIALPVLALHPIFVLLAAHYRKTEPFRPVAPEPEQESERAQPGATTGASSSPSPPVQGGEGRGEEGPCSH